MTQKQKAIDRLLSEPADFSWNELQRVLRSLGYVKVNKGKTSGSRVAFDHSEHPLILLHRPHPKEILDKAAVKQVKQQLLNSGLI